MNKNSFFYRQARPLCLLLTLCALLALFHACTARQESSASAGSAPVYLACLNIGKADCLLLFSEDYAYLIDTGYAQSYPLLRAALDAYGITRLDGVFLTHCHKDHAGALTELAQSNVLVDAWYASAFYLTEGAHPMLEAAQTRQSAVSWLRAGDAIEGTEGVRFDVLGPVSLNQDNENNNSLVMRFSSPQGNLLLCGDMKQAEEVQLLAAQSFAPCEVLKVGHHGDSGAAGEGLLSAVAPQIAVITTATEEEPDTPAAETLCRLAAADCRTFVTQDLQGEALLLTLQDGTVTAKDDHFPTLPPRTQGLTMTIDLEADTLLVENGGSESVFLGDCILYSSKGTDLYTLPPVHLSPGERLLFGSEKSGDGCDYYLSQKRIWSKKAFDAAVLYDAYGRALCRTHNGLSE